MKVAKWGNSLAVRLPAKLVGEMGLKEGDEIVMAAKEEGVVEVSVNEERQRAIERMRELSVPLPAGYKFDREELYDRGDREPRYSGSDKGSQEPEAAAD